MKSYGTIPHMHTIVCRKAASGRLSIGGHSNGHLDKFR